jgi:HJR/Mrr/RecB family endonuclease
MGYSTKVTQRVKDGGYDVDARREDEQILIQAKRHQNPIGIKTIRETAGLLEIEDPDKVVVVTSSRFTSTVEETDRLELIAGDQLCDLLTTNQINPKYKNE